MTRKSLKEIIKTYLHFDAPQQVRESFEKWFLDNDSRSEKDDALESIWEESDWPDYKFTNPLPNSSQIIENAEASDKKKRYGAMNRIGLWVSSTAAVILCFVTIFLLFNKKPDTQLCLASSDNTKAYFVLPDSSLVWLNRGSRLYVFNESEERTVRLYGEAYFEVRKDADHPFTVKVSDIDVTVLGTEFTVSAYDENKVTTYLQEGAVKISGPSLKDGVRLMPGESLVYDRRATKYSYKSTKIVNHTSWIKERLVFDNESLFDILETLCHWYYADVRCDDENFAREAKLSFTVRQEPINEILDAITKLIPVNYHYGQSGEIILSVNH